MKNSINFSKKYDKFHNDIFTTIRGKTAFKQYEKNDIIQVLIKYKYSFHAKILNKKVKWISEIPLDVLQKDIAPQTCNSHEEFAEMMDSFWKWVDVTVETPVTLFTLERTKEIGYRRKTTQTKINPFKKKPTKISSLFMKGFIP